MLFARLLQLSPGSRGLKEGVSASGVLLVSYGWLQLEPAVHEVQGPSQPTREFSNPANFSSKKTH